MKPQKLLVLFFCPSIIYPYIPELENGHLTYFGNTM